MLLALALASAAPPAEEPLMPPMERTELVELFQVMVAGMDRDHDGRVSRAEWVEIMAGTGEADRALPVRMSFDAPPAEVFREMDSNADGLLTVGEFGRSMLANFDCLDADHDGVVRPAEAAAGRARCAAAPPAPAATP
jgi:Ca2+-binding EF-hand superfamily protein